jgi:acetylornithine deacetylase/succinyl-diaminopimelate desuccinylase-like protein
MRDSLGRDIAIKRMSGATDARHFVNLEVPIAIIGVPGQDAHGLEERAERAGLDTYEDMLVAFLNG